MEENWLGYDVGSAGRKATTAWVAFSGESISKIEKFYSTLKEDDERFKNASLFLAPESVDNQANISYLIQWKLKWHEIISAQKILIFEFYKRPRDDDFE